MYRIPFNKPFIIGKELAYISEAVHNGKLSGDGEFTQRCHQFFETKFGTKKALMTHSCTAALEMSAILCDVKSGDEIILPSYTFVSTANAFYLRGARLRFIDIRPDTLNMDENKIEQLITEKTKVIVPVHYAGVSCEMNKILEIAHEKKIFIIEDAAQGVNSTYKGRYLGTIGDLGTYSFHETKNFISGEGGALLINRDAFVERAEIIREKGTNRSKFFRGEVDKYTWVDQGSSYLPSDLISAFLYAQLENMDLITEKRKKIYDSYYQNLINLEHKELVRLPTIPSDCMSNYHMFYIILQTEEIRTKLIEFLKAKGIYSVFHYVPLHLSPMGLKMNYSQGDLPVTENLSLRLLRLPFFYTLNEQEQSDVISEIHNFFYKN